MKNIQKLAIFLFLTAIGTTGSYASHKSNNDEYDDQTSSMSSSNNSSFDSDDEELIGFFIEKPTLSWQTKHFKNPIIVQAKVFRNESGKIRLQIIEIPQSIYFNYMPEVSAKDFIQCDGPVGEIGLDEYKKIVEAYAPDYYKKIERQAVLHAVRYKRTVIDDVEFA